MALFDVVLFYCFNKSRRGVGGVRSLVFHKVQTWQQKSNGPFDLFMARCLYTTDKLVPVSWFWLVDRLVHHPLSRIVDLYTRSV